MNDFLKRYMIDNSILPLIKLQLTKIFNHYNEGKATDEQLLKSKSQDLEKRMKELKIRFGLGEIDRDTYDLTLSHLSDQLQNVTKERNLISPKISNLEKLLSNLK